MRANKKKFQSFVGKISLSFRDSMRFLGDLLEKLLGFLPNLLSASGINHTIARNLQQPCLRFFRNSLRRPSFQRRDECVAKRVFRAGDVARSCSEISDQSSIRIPRYGFNCNVGRRFTHRKQDQLQTPSSGMMRSRGQTITSRANAAPRVSCPAASSRGGIIIPAYTASHPILFY